MTPTQLAFQYLTLQPTTRFAIIAGFILLGGLASAAIARPKGRLGRAPYFALATGLNLLLVLLDSTMFDVFLQKLGVSSALYVTVGLELLTLLVFGFLWGRLAIPRSRDMFGSAKFAYIAFVPVVGYLWFILAPTSDHVLYLARRAKERGQPDQITEQPSLPFYLKGTTPVLLGFLFLLAVPLINYADMQFTKEVRDFAASVDVNDLENNPDVQPDYGLMIRLMGLEVLLQSIAEAETATEIEPGFAFRKAVAEGKTLSYIYALDGLGHDRQEEAQDVTEKLGKVFCEDADMAHIYAAKGSLRLVVLGDDDLELAVRTLDETVCLPGAN